MRAKLKQIDKNKFEYSTPDQIAHKSAYKKIILRLIKNASNLHEKSITEILKTANPLRLEIIEMIKGYYKVGPNPTGMEAVYFNGRKRKCNVVYRNWVEDFVDEDTSEVVKVKRAEIVMIDDEPVYVKSWSTPSYESLEKLTFEQLLKHCKHSLQL
jgi:hypothetical protein